MMIAERSRPHEDDIKIALSVEHRRRLSERSEHQRLASWRIAAVGPVVEETSSLSARSEALVRKDDSPPSVALA